MAEMLVFAVDKINADDPHKHAQLHKRGDVVVIVPDDHLWSDEERSHARWTIVKVPGATEHDLSAFVARESEDADVPHKILQLRAFSFDLGAHNGSPLTLAQALALKRRKPVMSDPDVFQ